MEGLYLGLDIGTQGTKALVIDVGSSRIVARANAPHEAPLAPTQGAAEQDPADWMEALRTTVAQVGESVDLQGVRGIGISGQQHGFVPLDQDGAVIRPAKLWCDTSTSAEAEELSRAWGRAVPAGFTASKILWLRRHEPEHFARLATVLLPHDYVDYRLTGALWMEAGDASGTGFFDPVERDFVPSQLDTIDANLAQRLPALIQAGSIGGVVSAQAAAKFALPSGCPVSSGGGDNMMSAIGSGATRPGVCVVSLGTSATVFTQSASPIVDPAGEIAAFCDSTGAWLPLLCVMNATGVTEEVRTAFGATDPESLEELTRAAAAVPAGCEGLTFLPFLQGERVPSLPEATGSLLGLRPGLLRPGHLFRAALEGVSLNLAQGVDRMRSLGISVSAVRLVGGAAKNELWRQILADTLGAPVELLEATESAALGAALHAAWSVGRTEHPGLGIDEVAAPFVRGVGTPVQPEPRGTKFMRELRLAFQEQVGHIYRR